MLRSNKNSCVISVLESICEFIVRKTVPTPKTRTVHLNELRCVILTVYSQHEPSSYKKTCFPVTRVNRPHYGYGYKDLPSGMGWGYKLSHRLEVKDHTTGVYPGFLGMKQLRELLFPAKGNTGLSQGNPQQY